MTPPDAGFASRFNNPIEGAGANPYNSPPENQPAVIMTDFTPGQRWLSESETELGLGIIKELDYRLVTVGYPAVEE
ncbi:MAG: hypothetical protein KAG70_15020, partial [Alcanivorax sp.]|nr:hypothetical protein [Alcanivorax sp.]